MLIIRNARHNTVDLSTDSSADTYSLTKTIDAELEGEEMARWRDTVNDMVYSLRIFSSEVTRVSLEVGTEGQLGGQAVVHGVEGVWKELVGCRRQKQRKWAKQAN